MKVRTGLQLFLAVIEIAFHWKERKTHMRKGQSDIRTNLSVSISVINFSLFAEAE